ncbi:MAG TPA: phosphatase PAP2 family protein [Candidatus Dormibacteraeota bacterium]
MTYVLDAARLRSERRIGPVRVPLLAIGLLAVVAFAVDTYEAALHPYLPFDLTVTRALQAVGWGPLAPVFGVADWLDGARQGAVAVAALALVLLLNRRAMPLLVVAALGSAACAAIEHLVARPRPTAGLVHVVRHAGGFSYPSGHVVFLTWFLPLLVLALLRPHLPAAIHRRSAAMSWGARTPWIPARAGAIAACVATPVVITVVAAGRVVTGQHWPSDVLGGLALGVAWTALVLSVRRLSDPVAQKGPGARTRAPARLWG